MMPRTRPDRFRVPGAGMASDFPEMTPKAAQAFADYAALGAGRSLDKLVTHYQSRPESAPTRQLTSLKVWSTKYGWQDRIKRMAAEQTAEVAELERAILVNGTRELHRRYGNDTTMMGAKTDELLSVLGHVKPKEAHLNIGGSATIRIIGADVEAI